MDGWGARRSPQRAACARARLVSLRRSQQSGEGRADPLWRTWPTSTDVFPGQFGAGGTGHHDLAALPGGLLEHPAPDTPRLAGADSRLGLDPGKLELPGGPKYQVPQQVLDNNDYKSCKRQHGGVWNLIDGKNFQNNGDVMIPVVAFSPDAAKAIADGPYWNAAVLDSQISGGAAQPDMPLRSVALKIMLWPVRGDDGGYTPCRCGTTCRRMPTRSSSAYVRRSNARSTPASSSRRSGGGRWRSTPASGFRRPADASYLGTVPVANEFDCRCEPIYKTSPIKYQRVPTVSLDRFYTSPRQERSWTVLRPRATRPIRLLELRPGLRLRARQAGHDRHARHDQGAGRLDLPVGMVVRRGAPIAPRSQDEDTRKRCDRYTKARPDPNALAPGVWQNYLMTTTYRHSAEGAPNVKSWPPMGPDPDGVLAGRVQPLHRARCRTSDRDQLHELPSPCRLAEPGERQPPIPRSQVRLPGSGHRRPGLLESFPVGDERLLRGLVEVDSLWTISDRAYYPTREESVPAH